MSEAIVITPVKDSPDTTDKTIEAVCQSDCDIDYFVFNDFSLAKTKQLLLEKQKKWNFQLIHLEDITDNPSPNYKLVLESAQKMAIEKQLPLIIVESDVIVKKDTLSRLLELAGTKEKPGLIGAITVDEQNQYNFPYTFEKIKNNHTVETSHSLSFCCTYLSLSFLQSFNFSELSSKKDWYDVTISRQAKKAGFKNYMAKGVEVLHLPHSSRPWKNLKYNNPLLYYYKKLIHKRDRI
jgi:hypothetical protein